MKPHKFFVSSIFIFILMVVSVSALSFCNEVTKSTNPADYIYYNDYGMGSSGFEVKQGDYTIIDGYENKFYLYTTSGTGESAYATKSISPVSDGLLSLVYNVYVADPEITASLGLSNSSSAPDTNMYYLYTCNNCDGASGVGFYSYDGVDYTFLKSTDYGTSFLFTMVYNVSAQTYDVYYYNDTWNLIGDDLTGNGDISEISELKMYILSTGIQTGPEYSNIFLYEGDDCPLANISPSSLYIIDDNFEGAEETEGVAPYNWTVSLGGSVVINKTEGYYFDGASMMGMDVGDGQALINTKGVFEAVSVMTCNFMYKTTLNNFDTTIWGMDDSGSGYVGFGFVSGGDLRDWNGGNHAGCGNIAVDTWYNITFMVNYTGTDYGKIRINNGNICSHSFEPMLDGGDLIDAIDIKVGDGTNDEVRSWYDDIRCWSGSITDDPRGVSFKKLISRFEFNESSGVPLDNNNMVSLTEYERDASSTAYQIVTPLGYGYFNNYTGISGTNYLANYFYTTDYDGYRGITSTNDYSINIFYKTPPDDKDSGKYLGFLGNAGDGAELGLFIFTLGGSPVIYAGGSQSGVLSSDDGCYTLEDSTWYDLMITVNSSGITLFVNNEFACSDSSFSTSSVTPSTFYLFGDGAMYGGGSSAIDFYGTIDEISIYSPSLTTEERLLYTENHVGPVDLSSFSNILYKMNDNKSTTNVVDYYNYKNGTSTVNTDTMSVAGYDKNAFYFSYNEIVSIYDSSDFTNAYESNVDWFGTQFWIKSSSEVSDMLLWHLYQNAGTDRWTMVYSNGDVVFGCYEGDVGCNSGCTPTGLINVKGNSWNLLTFIIDFTNDRCLWYHNDTLIVNGSYTGDGQNSAVYRLGYPTDSLGIDDVSLDNVVTMWETGGNSYPTSEDISNIYQGNFIYGEGNEDNETLPLDIDMPVFSSQSINATPKINEEVAMAVTITDDNADSYKFFWNNSGSIVYDEPVIYTSSVEVVTIKQNLLPRGNNVCWGVWANDTYGNEATSDLNCFNVVDTDPSKTILFMPENNQNYTSVDLQYSASDLDGDNLMYYVYLNYSGGVPVLGEEDYQFTTNVTNLSIVDGTYTIKVAVLSYVGGDEFGFGEFSDEVTFTKYTLDVAPPVVTVLTVNMAFNETYNTVPLWINFSTDESAVCSLNNANWSLVDSTGTFFSYADSNITPEGFYDVGITCEDALLNSGITHVYFYIDNTPPYVHYYSPNHYGTTSVYTLGTFVVNISVDDVVGLTVFNLNITKVSDNSLMLLSENNISGIEYSYVNSLDVSSWQNTTYNLCTYVCDSINCDVDCADFNFIQPSPPVITYSSPTTPYLTSAGQTVSFLILANDTNDDVLTYKFYVDDVIVSEERYYDYLLGGHIGENHLLKAEVYDNSPMNYMSSYLWSVTINGGVTPQYTQSDLKSVVIDGIGTAGSALVQNIDLIVIFLAVSLVAVIAVGIAGKFGMKK